MQTQTVKEGTLTLREVALRLGVSKWSVRRYLKRFGISGTVVHSNGRPEIHLGAGDVDHLARLLEVSLEEAAGREASDVEADPERQHPGTTTQAKDLSADDRENRQLVLRGVTRAELRELLVEAFTEAMQKTRAEEPPALRRFHETKPGRIMTAILYGIVGVMAVACLAFAGAIAKRFDLVGTLVR